MFQSRKQSLIRQILYLIIMMLIILLISFTISNTIAKRIVEKKVTESVSKILLQVEENIGTFYSDMEGISNSLLYSPTIQTYMSQDDILARILMDKEIVSVFSNTFSLKDSIKGIQLYDQEGVMLVRSGEMVDELEPLDNRPVSAVEYSGTIQIRSKTWYTITVPIYNLKNNALVNDYRGKSVFMMDASHFNNILTKSKLTPNARFLLLDQNQQIVASADQASAEEVFRIEDWSGDPRYLVQTVTLSRSGWKLVSAIPKDELFQDLDIVKRLNIATYLVLFCMLCLFLLIFYSRILKPVKTLMDFIRSYPKQGRHSRFHVVYRNEIGVLASNLNQMLDDIDTLSRDIQITQKQKYEIEIVKKQMEISAYRNQINPHFLYNTLECIRAIALYYKVEEIVEISTSLSKMFRYSVKGSNFVSVKDEITQLKEYAKIIEFRFQGKIQIAVHADEHLFEEKTLKMLLQPIVENAVFHGLEKKIDPGTVVIHVRKTSENEIQYVIQDNGCGMDARQLDELTACLHQFELSGNDRSHASKGIGLSNIYRRLKLFYGDQATMTIDSTLDLGTIVCISFPAHHEQEETEEKE